MPVSGSKRFSPLAEVQTEAGDKPNELTEAEFVKLDQLGGTIEGKIASVLAQDNIMSYGIFSMTRAAGNVGPLEQHMFVVESHVAFRVLGSQVSRKRLRNLESS